MLSFCQFFTLAEWLRQIDSNPPPRSGSGRSGVHACVRGLPGIWWGDEGGTPGSSDYLHCRHDRLPTLTPRGFDWHKQPTWIRYLVERLEPD
jgi:hypothetical protein